MASISSSSNSPLQPFPQLSGVPSDFSDPPDLSWVSGRTILITGGISGFGRAMARKWASAPGVKPIIILGDIVPTSKGSSIVENLQKETGNPNIHFLNVDVANWESQVTFFRRASALAGVNGIDTVAASAGVGGVDESREFMAPLPTSRLDALQKSDCSIPAAPSLKTVDVNLTGSLYTVYLALAHLSARRATRPGGEKSSSADGSILLLGSFASILPLPAVSLYGSSKHALLGLFRSLRLTMPHTHPNVRLNILCPYFVHTPIVGMDGALILAGGAPAEIEDVVNAATWCVGRSDMRGRALAVSPKMTREEAKSVGLVTWSDAATTDKEASHDSGATVTQFPIAVWDCYAHDYELSDLFGRRIIKLIEMRTAQRGWRGIGEDLYKLFSSVLTHGINKIRRGN